MASMDEYFNLKKAAPAFDEGRVENYIKYFNEQIQEISNATLIETHKEILYVCILDTLSKTVYPTINSQRKKFSLFVQNFTKWPYWTRISLPHLVRLLIKTPQPEFNALRKYAYDELRKWQEGRIISMDEEPEYEVIKKMWPKNKEYLKPIEGVTLEYLQHHHLLYIYRNSIVHALNRPGYAMDMGKHKQPIYHTMHRLSGEITWELLYPTEFFKGLCKQALKLLFLYYEANCIDPYFFNNFGTYWIKELN